MYYFQFANPVASILACEDKFYVFIRCTNTFGSETPAEGIGRKSGLGTSILNDIAQKYDGKFILDECGGKYIASISLKEVR